MTVSQLIARHAPTESTQSLSGDVPGDCYICGLPTERGQRRAPSDAFTAWASCGQGDVLCPDCAATLSWRDVRMFSWLATPDGVRFEGRGDRGWLWDVLADPPEPPYAIYITRGGQKQGWISGVRMVATSRERTPILTDWTDRPIMLTRADWRRYAPLVERLRGYGIGRNAVLTGEFTSNQWSKALTGGYAADLVEAQTYAGDPRWEAISHVSRKPDESSTGGDPVRARESGDDRSVGLGL